MSHAKVVEKIKTRLYYILYTYFFFRKTCRWWGNVEKHCRARNATDDNTG